MDHLLDARASPRTDELGRYLLMQQVVADLLADLVRSPLAEVDVAVDAALEVLGTFCDVDRAYVFAVDDAAATLSNTHEWCAAGVQPEIGNLQDLPQSMIHAWWPALRAGHAVVVDDVDALPPARADEQELLAGQGIRSLAVVPMIRGGQLDGFLGLDAVHLRRDFLPGEVLLLRSVADVISSALLKAAAHRTARTAETRLAALSRAVSDLVAVVDRDAVVAFASESHRQAGVDPDRLVGRPWVELLDEPGRRLIHQALDHMPGDAEGTAGASGLATVVGDVALGGGTPGRWLEVSLSDLRSDPAIGGVVLTARDVTDRREAEVRLAHEATHDALTGLPNRSHLHQRLEELCGRGDTALLFVDVDRFKLVNDTAGHAAGDELLRAVGTRLQAVAHPHLVGRFGGDEFVVLVHPATPEEVDRLVHAVQEGIQHGVRLRGGDHRVTVSVGSAVSWTSGRDGGALLRDADTAMYVAKELGRNQAVAFDGTFRERALRRGQVFQKLPAALAAGELCVAYQPIMDLRTRRVSSVEALARWTDPDLGPVSPGEFIAAAEELGVIDQLGGQVLATGLAEVAPLLTGLSVNLSPRQLTDPALPQVVADGLAGSGVTPDRLILEITESILVDQPARTRDVLQGLRGLGVRVALDDFGTGYSSLAQLRDLPIDILKVDRSFVGRIDDGSDEGDRDVRFVRAIIALGHDLGMGVTAEGVETPSQLALLTDLGCDAAQGYLIGRPGPIEVAGFDAALLG